MNKRVAVIGLGIFGFEVAQRLEQEGFVVIAIDKDAEIVESIKDKVSQALVLDSTDELALKASNVDSVGLVINAIGMQNLEQSILTTAILHQFNIPKIIARATSKLHKRILQQVGATEVINPEQKMGRRLATRLANPNLTEMLNLAGDVCVAEVPLPFSFCGKSLLDVDVRKRYGVTVVGVQRMTVKSSLSDDKPTSRAQFEAGRSLDQKRKLIVHIDAKSDKFDADDTLVVIGREKDIAKLVALD